MPGKEGVAADDHGQVEEEAGKDRQGWKLLTSGNRRKVLSPSAHPQLEHKGSALDLS